MHRCLQIDEIVRNMLAYVNRADCLSVAMTCHALLETALDEVWRSLTTIEPLLRCLPPGCISQGSTNTIVSERSYSMYRVTNIISGVGVSRFQ